jgi:two-component system, chemotaxis family, sensor kinase CheA
VSTEHFTAHDYEALLEVFLAESFEGVAAMEESLLALESHRDDLAHVQTLFRLAHTLKGNASSLGLSDLAALTHALEDVLERLRDDAVFATDDVVTVLLESVDAVREMLGDAAGSRS